MTTQHWRQTKPGVFRLENGSATIAFRADGTLVSSQTPASTYPKLSWYASPTLHLIVVAGTAAVLLATFVFLPLRAAVRVRRRGASPTRGRFALVLGWLTSACVALFGTAFAAISSDPNRLMQIPFTGDLTLSIALNIMSAMGVLTVGLVVAAVLAWAQRWWSLLGRSTYSLVALAAIAFVTIAINYRLIGVPFTLTV